MRRWCVAWAGAAAVARTRVMTTKATASNNNDNADSSSSSNGSDSSHTATPSGRHARRVSRTVRVREEPLLDFVPTASEQPELLLPYEAAPRRLSATASAATALLASPPHASSSSSWHRRVRVFVASAVTGACSVALVCYTLRTRLQANLADEVHLVEALAQRNAVAASTRPRSSSSNNNVIDGDMVAAPSSAPAAAAVLGTFVAPSTYAELQAKLQQHRREADERVRRTLESRAVLHTELLYRFKCWWNGNLANVQRALAQEAARREASTAARIDATLRLRGYEVLSVRPLAADEDNDDSSGSGGSGDAAAVVRV